MIKAEASSNYMYKISESIAHFYICVSKIIVRILEAHKERTFGKSHGDL